MSAPGDPRAAASNAEGAPEQSKPDDWDDHWGRYDAAARLNPAQAFRRRLILRALELEGDGRGVRLLELGSGQGDLAVMLLERFRGLELLGLDRSAHAVGLAAARASAAAGARGHFSVHDLSGPFEVEPRWSRWATHAVCAEMLEHVDDPVAVLRNSRALLAPGARLVVTVPGGPRSAFDRQIGHRRHFTRQALRELVEAAGFEACSVVGAGFPTFNLYRLAVVASGSWLARGAAEPRFATRRSARAAAAGWRLLLRLASPSGSLGWQRVAIGRLR